ncbi:hypothetical protein LIER_20366 [Lithospermum erythrorhizon]|uniref:Malonyl-CoA:ACP transacylase (MAT) domain-containing protein n=1 Tax=Lithospermum erythrorhizon TaxID=34254 RepID=A0AAV3QP00_LITER
MHVFFNNFPINPLTLSKSLHSLSRMSSSSLVLPSVSLPKLNLCTTESPKGSCFIGFNINKYGFKKLTHVQNLDKARIFMSVSVGSQTSVDDALFKDYKPNTAFLFPGQGAQAVGMGAEAQNVPAAAKLYKKANEILGFDLLDICINGPKDKLDSTVLSQPAIYVTSLAAVEVLGARDGGQQIIDSADVTCGLSLGEYTALAFAGAFSFEDGLKLVRLRGEAMQDAADAANSAMVSIIGLDSEKVQKLCDAANEEVDEADKVQIANFLCIGNYAVSGGLKGIEAVEAKAKSFKARMTVRLAVAGAFHTGFMEPAVSRLEAALAATEIRTPRIPVISNVDAQPHADPETIKKILARQSPRLNCQSNFQYCILIWSIMDLERYLLTPFYSISESGSVPFIFSFFWVMSHVIAGIIKRMDKGASIENIGT